MPPQPPDDEPTWASLSLREKVLAAFGMAGLGLGVLTVIAVVFLAGILAIAFAARSLIETDSAATLVWACLLLLPCGLLAGVIAYPARLLMRLAAATDKTKRGAEMLISAATTFLAAIFVETFTPGLRVQHPWLPALLATLLVALANLVINHMEDRKNRRDNKA
ncbi:hypothetical protein [Streptomyces sp. CT34]|uniref:hypothetical protein n=1 Tax=Streptomyces sp. CT34 TaxID=1553907 RepID=UPI001F51E441|nr:hypothetical protein [Streptomyces sp. CT34]